MAGVKNIWVRIADTPLYLEIQSERVYDMYQRYSIDIPIDEDIVEYKFLVKGGIPLSVSEEEIEREQEKKSGNTSTIEGVLLFKKICDILLRRHILLIQGTVVKKDNNAVLVISDQKLQLAEEGYETVRDDNALLSFEHTRYITVFPTPYCKSNSGSAVLKSVMIVVKGESNTVTQISKSECMNTLVKRCYRSEGTEALSQVMKLNEYLSDIPVYKLVCNHSGYVAECVKEALKQHKT